MNFSESYTPREEELIQQYVSGELDEPDAKELLYLFETDDAFGRMAFENVQAQILLERIARKKNPVDLLLEMDVLDGMFQAEARKAEAGAKAASAKMKSAQYLSWSAALILLVLFALGIRSEFGSSPGSVKDDFIPVARIADSVEAVWEDGKTFKKGQQLGLEKLNLLSGVVRLQFGNEVEVVLEGPTEFVIRGDDETFCRTGKLSATVPPQGKGFKVVTPFATVVDLGTEFTVRADEEKIDVQVVKGAVDVARSGSDKLQLVEGLAAIFDFKGGTRQFEADVSAFFSTARVRKLWEQYAGRRREVWETEKRRRLEDPNLLLSLDDVRVNGCGKVEGCRPDERAFRIRSVGAYLDASMPGEHRSLTLVATVRFIDMRNFTNTLCLGSGFLDTDGVFFWQLSNNGVLRFHLRDGDVRRFDTGVVIDRNDWFTWLQLAVVADGESGRIRHYVDGREVASIPWRDPVPLRMPKGAIGNAPPDQRKRTPRFWNGDIDTFYIFSRVLSGAEIAEMHENIQ